MSVYYPGEIYSDFVQHYDAETSPIPWRGDHCLVCGRLAEKMNEWWSSDVAWYDVGSKKYHWGVVCSPTCRDRWDLARHVDGHHDYE